MRVLCVSLDEERNDVLATALRSADRLVDLICGPALVVTALASAAYDAVIVQLRSLDSAHIVRNLRGSTDVPILVLGTTRAKAAACLDAGADDYLTSPFELEELRARLRAVWRRHEGHCTSIIEHGELNLDVAKHELTRRGVHIDLTAHEFTVLEHLMQHAGTVVPAHRLEDTLYGRGEEISSNTIQVYVHKLRRKIGADAIRCVRGAGYVVAA